MPIDELSGAVQYVMDLLGIFAFALSGAFLAVRKDFDIFGTVILSEAAGLGGGLFRDVVLGVTPVAFTDLGYFFTPCAAAAIVYFGHRLIDDDKVREGRLFDTSDAAALGLFSVTGTVKALAHGFNIPAAVTLGCVSAFGGGVLASLLALEQPALLRWNHDLYALPTLAGATLTALLHYTGLLNVGTAIGTSLFAFGLRLLALRYNWRTPRSHFWRDPFSGMRHQPPTAKPDPAATPAQAVESDTVRMPRIEADSFIHRRDDTLPMKRTPAPGQDPRLLLNRSEKRNTHGRDQTSLGQTSQD
ncbi:trimeric intracellular cation channel family protein [Streptomyces sp. HC44]|uniref:Trimeric intracellular cation channel family protein n=1 Tax=Streptomyces scabichelini TaxID=2711217 RepID=A0A6G4VG53_9ACTN|nr:trimeric intracellular cation channel family protein [Streptomyces scabichelini]NGO12753.1 trimeric intracellular cation channel family protein [Streptomyces scabichelini]